MKKSISLVIILSFLSACATRPENIQAQYVSPMQYQSYSCEQLESEAMRISRKVTEVTGKQSKQATGDAVAMGVGLVLFWPALFFLIGDDKKEELARLKGEYDAIEQSAIQKNCSLAQQMANQRNASSEQAEKEAVQTQQKSQGNWN